MKAIETIELPHDNADPRVELTWMNSGGMLVACASDWCGDTETGFGARVECTLKPSDVERLRMFLVAHVQPPDVQANDVETATARAILESLGGPMLVDANVGRARRLISALQKLGYTITKATEGP